MAQWATVLTPKPINPKFHPRTHMVGDTDSHKIAL